MPTRILVVEKMHQNSMESIMSSSDDEESLNKDEINTSIALLPSSAHLDLSHILISDELKETNNKSFDPNETTLEEAVAPDYDLEVDATTLDLQGSPCHIVMNQTLQLTQTPYEQTKIESKISSSSQLISLFPKLALEHQSSEFCDGSKDEVEKIYRLTYQPMVRKILHDNKNVNIPQFSSSQHIDERISRLYEMIDCDVSIRKVLNEISHSNKMNSYKKGFFEDPHDSYTIHESQEYSVNLSTANVHHELHRGDTDDIPSIEVVRAEMENDLKVVNSFQSPVMNQLIRQSIKRLASASAKRGMDRKKTNAEYKRGDEAFVNGIDNDENSDPFDAYLRFSQHVNDLMKDDFQMNVLSDLSVHSESKPVHDNSSMFMGSALNSQASSPQVSVDGVGDRNESFSLADESCHSEIDRNSQKHQASFPENSSNNDLDDGTNFAGNSESKLSRDSINKCSDSIIEDDDDVEEVNRSTSLSKSFLLGFDPLDIYRAPKWAKSYIKRRDADRISTKEVKDGGHRSTNEKLDKPQQLPTLTWFQEPFKEFGCRESDKMEVVAEWLNARDDEDENDFPHRVILLALKLRQIISLVSHMLVQNGVHSVCRSQRYSSEKVNENNRKAGTIIVARDKSDLEKWYIFLRERTSFTVLNHAEIPSTERRRKTLSMKASGYDVVLTTYDAIKSKEVNVVLDENGRASMQTECEGGWYSSRVGDQVRQQCETLSQLHTLEWHRVVFIDSLGRQGYLTKPSTSRSQVSLRLKSDRRAIFFERSDEEHQFFFEDKIKDSRRQLVPLARLLGICENVACSAIVGSVMLDYRDVRDDCQDACNSISHSQSSDEGSVLTE